MTTNIVTAAFGAFRVTRTRPLYQYDYGQILQFSGIQLPDAYTVHFSNQQIGGEAVKQVGGADGVQIPDEMLTSGQNVYAWVFLHTGADDGETMYAVTIPVQQRPRPTEEEPTPVQQGLIEQAIAALNAGVEQVERIADGIPDTIDTALAEAKASGEFDGADGVSPTVVVTEITGGHQVSVTDAEGTEIFDVLDGEPGADGFSPSARVEQTSTGATVTVTDKTGTTTANLTNGDDGISPTITVTDITGGHRVTITDETGPHSFDVMDGTGSVQDVQVAGTSVLQDGVANVPMASPNVPGVIVSGTIAVSGTTPTIAALPGIRYVCGEVATLDIVTPATGIVDVVFTSGAPPAVLTVTPPSGMTMKWANEFDPTSLEADTTYEINIMDGCLAVAGTW